MIDRSAEIMMRRNCKIRRLSDGDETGLAVDFLAPYPDNEGTFFGEGRLICDFFSRRFRVIGEDEVQALSLVMGVMLNYMQHASDSGEYLIYWAEPGDLKIADFWRYQL